MIQPPMIGVIERAKLSSEDDTPSAPPLRFGGAICVIKLLTAGRATPVPNENRTATAASAQVFSARASPIRPSTIGASEMRSAFAPPKIPGRFRPSQFYSHSERVL